MTRDVAAIFSEVLGPGAVIAEETGMAGYLTDWSGDHRGIAAAVLRPGSVEQVSSVVQLCHQHGLAIIPLGGNTGLVAGGIDRQGGRAVVVSLERMNRIRAVDPVDFILRADAGCTLQAIKDASEAADCLFPLALGAQGSCRIGGNAATNAGGVNVLRYGMARDLILGLEVVLPDGEVWNGFSGLRKDNRGYDLKQIFIGSEGTLGIVTGVEVKLFPRPTTVETAYLGVASFADAMRLFARARRACSDLMTAFEVIGAECIDLARLIHPDLHVPVAAPVHILMEVSSSGPIDIRSMVETFLAGAVEEG
ncbi:FAD-binding oxidoreductase, partial [Rhizobiaceae sp. 2RAB30]